MTQLIRKSPVLGILVGILLGAASATEAQDSPWSGEVAIGWDNGLTGNINASAIGSIQNQVVVITSNSYNDVYGAGLHLRFGGGYLFKSIFVGETFDLKRDALGLRQHAQQILRYEIPFSADLRHMLI